VAAYYLALQERTGEHVPLDWAVTQNNIGTLLLMLGERESGTARLEEAVLAFDASMPLGAVITKSHVEKSREGACASGQEEELVPLPVCLSCTPYLEAEAYVWFSDLPNQFKCSCQGTNFDLQSMRRTLRATLGSSIAQRSSTGLIPLHNRSALMDICRRFSAILNKKPKEEILQISNRKILYCFISFHPSNYRKPTLPALRLVRSSWNVFDCCWRDGIIIRPPC
jgi:hypothetical protein